MSDILFYGRGDLRSYLEQRKLALKNEVQNQDPSYLLNVSETDFCDYLVGKFSIEPPVIKDDEIYVQSQNEADIDVSQDFQRAIFDRSRSAYIKGLSITIAVPFDGSAELFNYQPRTHSLNPPRGEVKGQEVLLKIRGVDLSTDQVKKQYTGTANQIKKHLEYVRNDVESFNAQLPESVKQFALQRKKKLLDNLGLVASLGIPIKKRENTPITFAVPEICRKPKLTAPVATTNDFKPEPALDMGEYENILEIIQNMELVMERSPKAFADMCEEDIRQQLLVPLNGQYEGRATGETFNYEGKTDILIRENNENIFIAECKFWKGEKELLKAVDQLLGYVSWRDTKTALILFNRNKEFSTVLEKIDSAIKTHPCFKQEVPQEGETTFRYIFHQPDDINRELILTVMAFNVPEKV